jgi:hypothetical protein
LLNGFDDFRIGNHFFPLFFQLEKQDTPQKENPTAPEQKQEPTAPEEKPDPVKPEQTPAEPESEPAEQKSEPVKTEKNASLENQSGEVVR